MADEMLADMGKYVIGPEPTMLVSRGLGSCVGCAVWDKNTHLGGLAHIMLPDSKEYSGSQGGDFNMNKFADTALTNMIEEMKKKGSHTKDMVAKLAGGAHMFGDLLTDDKFNIGQRNFDSAVAKLTEMDIRVSSSDIGGGVGRTIKFNTQNGDLTVQTKDNIKTI